MDKMTNVKALAYILDNCDLPAEVKEKVENIHATYVKKSAASGERKPTEKQTANAAIGEAVFAWLCEQTEPLTVADIMKGCAACAELESTQRLTPMLTKLATEGKVEKTVIKRRTHYSAVCA